MWRRATGRGRTSRRFPGGGRAFAATDIPGAILWLPMTAGVTLNGSTISARADQIPGSVKALTQGTAANQPLYVASGLNGKPVARYDGANDILTSLTGGLTGNAPHTIAVVGKINTITAAAFKGFVGLGDSGVGNGSSTIGYEGVGVRWYGGHNQVTPTGGAADLLWHVWIKVFDGVNQVSYIDGVVDQASAAVSYALDAAIEVGAYRTTVSSIAGDEAETVIYNRAITVAEVATLNAGLRAKWGI